ncbi:MAG: hypothetical protein SGILL_002569 [Bacillariaceae sp.]
MWIRSQKFLRRNPACTDFVLKTTGQRFTGASAVIRYLGRNKLAEEDRVQHDAFTPNSLQLSSRRLSFVEPKRIIRDEAPALQKSINIKTKKAMDDASSPFGFIEEFFTENPWQLLISTIFLNRTQRKMIDEALPKSVLEYSSQDETLAEMNAIVAPLGMTYKRARGIVRFCKDFTALLQKKGFMEETQPLAVSWTREEITDMFYCGDYAADAYQIFVLGDVHSAVKSNDHALLAYVDWKQSTLR